MKNLITQTFWNCVMVLAAMTSGIYTGAKLMHAYGMQYYVDGQTAGEWKGKAETYEAVMHLQTATMDALALSEPKGKQK